ncbi:Uncharacterised protein [uncultured archaeon]|nr:Uncharacterised protein [uncultured archaeon]
MERTRDLPLNPRTYGRPKSRPGTSLVPDPALQYHTSRPLGKQPGERYQAVRVATVPAATPRGINMEDMERFESYIKDLKALKRLRKSILSMLLWKFRDAPIELQELSEHGGDEDYILVVPNGVNAPVWADEPGPLGSSSVQVIIRESYTIYIGAHA